MTDYPTAAAVAEKLPTFKAFIVQRGAELLPPTNEWELLRFAAGPVVSIVYRTKRGATTMTGEAEKAWSAFRAQGSWRAPGVKPTKRKPIADGKIRAIVARDGSLCFYCRDPIPDDEFSIEHLVARAHGGPNHLSNMVLAHRRCNVYVGHLSAAEKIAIHVSARIRPTEFVTNQSAEAAYG